MMGKIIENTTRKRPWGCTAPGGCLGFTVLLIVTVVLCEFLLMGVAGLLIISEPLEKSDAVVVLSGGALDRIEEAARIYHENFAQMFIITETGNVLEGYNQPYNLYLRLEALKLEIPGGAILLTEEHAEDTVGEARAVLTLMQDRNMRSVIIVTDPYHTRRTRLVFHDVFKDQDIKVIVRPVRNSWYRSSTWWTSIRGWQATLQEYPRLMAYYGFLKIK